MAKTPSHITPLTVELPPAKSSTQLISEYVERLCDSGVRQKVVALTLGFKPNWASPSFPDTSNDMMCSLKPQLAQQ